VLFTDEARFCRDGIFNIHNQHQWAEECAYGVIHFKHHKQFSVNVRAEIVSDSLVGPACFVTSAYRKTLPGVPLT
jgi:hypothetical protein